MKKLILASKSPRRKKILKDWGFEFTVRVSPFDEELEEEKIKHLSPKQFVQYLALGKAKAAASQNPNSVILTADTTVDLEGESIAKPKDREDARQMLKKLSGKSHFLHTSYVIVDTSTGKTIQKTHTSEIKFRIIDDEEIEEYLKYAKIDDKAGAYAIQEEGGGFVEETKGDYLNIVGLPSKVKDDLIKFGIKPTNKE